METEILHSLFILPHSSCNFIVCSSMNTLCTFVASLWWREFRQSFVILPGWMPEHCLYKYYRGTKRRGMLLPTTAKEPSCLVLWGWGGLCWDGWDWRGGRDEEGAWGGDSAKRVHTSKIMVNALLIEHMQSHCLFPPHTIVNVSMVSFRPPTSMYVLGKTSAQSSAFISFQLI